MPAIHSGICLSFGVGKMLLVNFSCQGRPLAREKDAITQKITWIGALPAERTRLRPAR
jgi:hypothetical protein